MKSDDCAYQVVVQILAFLALVVGVCMEVQAFINVSNWLQGARSAGVLESLLGIVSLVLAGFVLICYGWFIGMMVYRWEKESQ